LSLLEHFGCEIDLRVGLPNSLKSYFARLQARCGVSTDSICRVGRGSITAGKKKDNAEKNQ
jgi:hypothetical protein